MDNEKSVQALSPPNTLNDNSSNSSITQNNSSSQAENADKSADATKKGKKRRRNKTINGNQKVATLAVKFYDEQIPNGFDDLKCTIQNISSTGKQGVQALLIKHDRDIVTDGIWALAYVKPHYHLIIRGSDKQFRFRVFTVLRQLGIIFRQGIDDDLWYNHGVETVGNFAGYAMYLTHETADAIAEGKEKYDISEIISNLTLDEIEQIRDGYIRLSENRKISTDELVALDKESYDLGYALKNFDEWYNSLPFSVRSNTKMRTIKESYNRGVDARVIGDNAINRCCIFIQGQPNTGKTYASVQALQGLSVLSVGGGGSGKFDKLRADHDAIVIDDDICPNLLNMTDNYICRAYRRNKDNPVWAGRFFIVTSNLSFEDWLISCGIHTRIAIPPSVAYINNCQSRVGFSSHYQAMLSRFFVCQLKTDANGVNHLALISPSTRGSVAEQQERLNAFLDFKRKFDAIICNYTPLNTQVDYSQYIEL